MSSGCKLIGPPQLLPEDGAVASPRSINRSPRRNNRPVLGNDTPSMSCSHRANNSLARRHHNSLDYNDYDPCAREEHDAESEFGQSTGSGFTILTDDTQPTSVSSDASSDASRGAPSGSFTDQLMKKLQPRGCVPSVSNGSPIRQLPLPAGLNPSTVITHPSLPPRPPRLSLYMEARFARSVANVIGHFSYLACGPSGD
jgi:cytokinesis protein